MSRPYYDFGNFKELMDEEDKEYRDYENIWTPDEERNPFYEKIHNSLNKNFVHSEIYVCPITNIPYLTKPSFKHQLEDINSYIYRFENDKCNLYKNTYIYACNLEKPDITISELVKIERRHYKHWMKFQKKSKTKYHKNDRNVNILRSLFKRRLNSIRRLLNLCKRLHYLKQLRKLFIQKEMSSCMKIKKKL